MNSDLSAIATRLREFSDRRDWGRFHTPKNLAMALSVEVAELVEHFQWLTPEEANALPRDPAALREVEDELADVGIYLVRMADVLGIDLSTAMARKIDRNEERFPVELMRGRASRPPEDAR